MCRKIAGSHDMCTLQGVAREWWKATRADTGASCTRGQHLTFWALSFEERQGYQREICCRILGSDVFWMNVVVTCRRWISRWILCDTDRLYQFLEYSFVTDFCENFNLRQIYKEKIWKMKIKQYANWTRTSTKETQKLDTQIDKRHNTDDTIKLQYSDTSANEDNSFRNHIR